MITRPLINNDNTSYLIFEIIKQQNAKTILDASMCIARTGMDCRQALSCEIPAEVQICGLKLAVTDEERRLPVWNTIYDELVGTDELLLHNKEKYYDIAFWFEMENRIAPEERHLLWDYMIDHSRCMIADFGDREFLEYIASRCPYELATVENSNYVIIGGRAGEQMGKQLQEGKTQEETVQIAQERSAESQPKQQRQEKQPEVRIYVAAHKQFEASLNEIYIPLHVGSEGKAPLGYEPDNTGDNISIKNPYYCELTGIYWMWKNVNCDVIGLCHYRRYLVRDGKLLTKEQIQETLENYDLILGNSSKPHAGVMVYDQFDMKHNKKDLDCCREVISERCSEYLDAFDWCMQSVLMHVGNMMICRKTVFGEYCEWLFDILAEVEKRTDMAGYSDYQKRLYGFLSERLLRVWVMNHEYRVREEIVMQTD